MAFWTAGRGLFAFMEKRLPVVLAVILAYLGQWVSFTCDTADGCEILHHQKDGWNPINHGLNHLSTGDSDFSTVSWGYTVSIRDWAFVAWVYCGDPMDEQQRGNEFLLTCFFLWIYWGWKKWDLWSILIYQNAFPEFFHQLFTKYLKDIFLGEYTENVSINDRDLTSPMGI